MFRNERESSYLGRLGRGEVKKREEETVSQALFGLLSAV